MITVSDLYKETMNKNIRPRSYISVSVGVINHDAQNSSKVDDSSESLYFSNKKLLFGSNAEIKPYLTLDENYILTDGSQYFPPRNDENAQFLDTGFVCASVGQSVKITFDNPYTIKGLTIDFGTGFPTRFKVITAHNEYIYDNYDVEFTTTDVFDNTNYIIIKPISMLGGEQRMRINKFLAGIGLVYTNQDVSDSSYSSSISPVADELPAIDFSVTVLDPQNRYNIDDSNSFINFLETKQRVSVAYGVDVGNEQIEWVNKAKLYLDSWESKKGTMTFNAVDYFAFMEDEYVLGNRIYTRTAYQEAESILADCGMTEDDYILDECLKDITLTNPMPECTHKEALQLIANACRCLLYQNADGKIVLQANFANLLDVDNVSIMAENEAEWSKKDNVLDDEEIVEYAELTYNFISLDNKLFLPKDKNYGHTGYVSSEASNHQGYFANNPKISLILPAAYQFFSMIIDFGGNPPQEMIIRTYYRGSVTNEFVVTEMTNKNDFALDYGRFEKIEFEITKGCPLNRVLVNHIELGDLTDYTVVRDNMFDNPTGYADRKTKDVYVKIYTFENESRTIKDEDGNEIEEIYPKEIEDEVYFQKNINVVGENQYVENPLVSTKEHASMLADWFANHFKNNNEYDVSYRGEPRISAGDIVFFESEIAGILQTEILDERLNFNGALRGDLKLKKALKNAEGELHVGKSKNGLVRN